MVSSWWFQPLKNMNVIMGSSSPNSIWKYKKYLSCHHLDMEKNTITGFIFSHWLHLMFPGTNSEPGEPNTVGKNHLPNLGHWDSPLVILLMEEILHQLIGTSTLSHYLQGFLYIPGGAGFLPWTEFHSGPTRVFPNPRCRTSTPTIIQESCSKPAPLEAS